MLFCSHLQEKIKVFQFGNELHCRSLRVYNETSLKSISRVKRPLFEIWISFSLCAVYRMISFSALNIDRTLKAVGIESSLQFWATCITSPLDCCDVYWQFHVSDRLISFGICRLISFGIHLVSAIYRRQPQSNIAGRLFMMKCAFRISCQRYWRICDDRGRG